MNEWTPKDFRKAAFAVGFGLALGKYFGGIVKDAVDAAIVQIVKKAAENGSEYAQNACRRMKVEYGETQKENELKAQIGFHC